MTPQVNDWVLLDVISQHGRDQYRGTISNVEGNEVDVMYPSTLEVRTITVAHSDLILATQAEINKRLISVSATVWKLKGKVRE